MSRLRESAKALSSRITAIWLSLLSWMRWRQRRKAKEQFYLELLERMQLSLVQSRKELRHLRLEQEAIQQRLEDNLHSQLLEALKPVALAMQRQDQLVAQFHQDQVHLLLEVLSNQQPPVAEQLSQRLGQQPLKR